jgi:phosphoadenosine phosphosulfate reductase
MRTQLDERLANQLLETLSPQGILHWVSRTFGERVCAQTSMQRRGSTLLHLLASEGLTHIPVVFVDTGFHFAETLETRDRLGAAYANPLVTLRAKDSPAEQAAREGRELWRDPVGYRRCCEMRKVVPLVEYVVGRFDAVLLGIHRTEGGRRSALPMLEYDPRLEAWVVYPLCRWTREEIDRYNESHGVFVHPLHARGFPSVGCAPCTTPVEPDEGARAGRWRHIREQQAQGRDEPLYCSINWADHEKA